MIYVYKNNVMQALRWIADYSYQQKALHNPTGPVIWSFVENYINIFEDTGLLNALQADQSIFGDKADQALRDLYAAINKVDDKLPDRITVDLPEMQIVRETAAKALQLILQSEPSIQ